MPKVKFTKENHLMNIFFLRCFLAIKSIFTAFYRSAWESEIKRKLNRCGKGVYLGVGSTFANPQRIILGDNVFIGPNALIQAMGGLIIGDNTIISRNVVIFTNNHNYEGNRLPYDDTHIKKQVNIGKNVWIGMNVIIIPGVSIGDGAIIGMGTVVSKDVPKCAIIGSQPHRIIRYRDVENYEMLDRNQMYGDRKGNPFVT